MFSWKQMESKFMVVTQSKTWMGGGGGGGGGAVKRRAIMEVYDVNHPYSVVFVTKW